MGKFKAIWNLINTKHYVVATDDDFFVGTCKTHYPDQLRQTLRGIELIADEWDEIRFSRALAKERVTFEKAHKLPDLKIMDRRNAEEK